MSWAEAVHGQQKFLFLNMDMMETEREIQKYHPRQLTSVSHHEKFGPKYLLHVDHGLGIRL